VKKILLIECEDNLREVLVQLLQLENFEVLGVGDAAAGTQAVAQFQPDLIICDMTCPGAGYSPAADWLQQDSRTASIPRICLTASRETMSKNDRAQPVSFLLKPFVIEQFLTLVRARLAPS
jgi:CheY-like chemotaxis protein